jgi:hypothetical protein
MRAFFPEGITLRRAEGFDKCSGGRKERKREEKGFTTEDGTRATEDAEKKETARACDKLHSASLVGV